MDERALSEALNSVVVVGADEACERAVSLICAAVPPSRRSRWRGGALGGLIAALLALTPPVQSAAEDLVRLVGLGGAPADEVNLEATPDVVDGTRVVGRGETPTGMRFQIVERQSHDPKSPSSAVTSVYLSYPSAGVSPDSLSLLNEGTLRWLREDPLLTYASVADTATSADAELMLEIWSADPVVAVEVSYVLHDERRHARVTSGPITPAATQLPNGEPVPSDIRYNVGFLPSALLGHPVKQQGLPKPSDGPGRRAFNGEVRTITQGLKGIQITGLDAEGNSVDHGDRSEGSRLQLGAELRVTAFCGAPRSWVFGGSGLACNEREEGSLQGRFFDPLKELRLED